MQDVRTRGYAVVFLWLTLSVATGHAATYHVSLSAGSDSTPCGAGPRRSIAAGIGCLASGDTLVVGGGTYTECINDYGSARPPSGRSWASATRIQTAPGETVILKQPWPECSGGAGTVEFGHSQYLIVDGFVLDGEVDASSINNVGIGSDKDAHHIRFQNIEVRHFRTNVSSYGSHLEFLNVHAHHAGHPVCPSPVGCHSYYLRGEHNLIDGGRIHDNTCNGIQFTSGGGGTIIRHNTVQNVEIFNNTCAGVVAWPLQRIRCNHLHHNGTGIDTYGPAQVERNRLWDNLQTGLRLQQGSGYAVHGNRIAGNPEAAIDTATYGATLTDYSDNACDRADPGCTQSGGRQAVAGECAGPQVPPPPPPSRPPLPAPRKR